MSEDRCKQKLMKGFHTFSCSRKAWKDGYCKQHHPDSVEERRKKSEQLFEQRIKQNRAPYDEITNLRAQLAAKEKELDEFGIERPMK